MSCRSFLSPSFSVTRISLCFHWLCRPNGLNYADALQTALHTPISRSMAVTLSSKHAHHTSGFREPHYLTDIDQRCETILALADHSVFPTLTSA